MRQRSVAGICLVLFVIAAAMMGCATRKGIKFESGLKKFEAKELDEAIIIFEKIAAGGGKYGNRARYYVGECYKLQFKWDESMAQFQMVVDSEPPTSYLGTQARNKISLIREGRKDIERTKIIHDNNPGTEMAKDALLELGSVYENKLDDYESAVAIYRQLIKESPGSAKAAQAQINIGYIYIYKLYDYNKGWPEFKAVNLENYPDLKYRVGEVDDLLRDINKTLAEIREHQDFIKRSQKRKIPTLKDMHISGYEIYSVRQDQVAQSFLAIGNKWRYLKNHPKALEAFQMLIDRLPLMLNQAAEARYGIAEMYHLDQARYFEAVDAYKEFIKYHPTYFRREEATYNVAICYESLRQYAAAYDSYKAYRDTYPEGKYFKPSELKVRQYEFDEDGDGFPYYKEAAAGTSDTDANSYPS